MTIIVGRTNVGARDGQNQDAMGWDDTRQLALVADGMGGYVSGEVASGIVKQTILEAAEPLDLDAAILEAHARIIAAVEEHSDYAGMGSTVVAMQIADRSCRIAWVGDSRGYLWRRGTLSALTRDHSVAEVLRDVENLSETQLRAHPLRNKVTQSLGIEKPLPSHGERALRRGDWILLCSDGLSSELRDDELGAVLSVKTVLEDAADALISGALAKGGHDNVTVVLVEYTGPSKIDFSGWRSERTVFWMSLLGGVLLAVAVAGVAWLLKSRK